MKIGIALFALLYTTITLGQQEFVTGYTPLPKEKYEGLKIAFCASATDRKLPASYVIPESYFPTPGSQGNIGSCVGWSTGYALASFYFAAKNKWGKPFSNKLIMSPAYVYNQIRECNCGPNCGSYIGDALDLLKEKGIVSWESMPYSDQSCSKPTQNHFSLAAKNKIVGWNRLIDKLNFNEYKEHLSNDVPVIIGASLGSKFGDYGYKKTADPFTCTQLSSGGHAMLVVGYDDSKRAFKIMNSWGKDWGVNGFIWVDYDCFKLMMGSSGGEAYVINKDYELKEDVKPDVVPASDVSADNFEPFGHWELIEEGHYYIDYGLLIDENVVSRIDHVTYIYDHPAFPNKYITVNAAPYFQTSYEGPYCLPNMQAVVYLKDGTSIKLEFDGCKTLEEVTEEETEEYDDQEEYEEEDWETYEIQPIVTADPREDKEGYYKFDIRLRGVESIKEHIVKVVYDFNDPTFKNRFVTVTDKSKGFRTGYDGWGCLPGLGATIYFDDDSSISFEIDMCDILGW